MHKKFIPDNLEALIKSVQYKEYYKQYSEQRKKERQSYREAHPEFIKKRSKMSIEERRKKDKAYRESNRDKLATQRKEWWGKNKEIVNERKRNKYRGDPEYKEKVNQCTKKWLERNKEKMLAYMKAYYESKKASGFRYMKDPATGKKRWVFVGNN